MLPGLAAIEKYDHRETPEWAVGDKTAMAITVISEDIFADYQQMCKDNFAFIDYQQYTNLLQTVINAHSQPGQPLLLALIDDLDEYRQWAEYTGVNAATKEARQKYSECCDEHKLIECKDDFDAALQAENILGLIMEETIEPNFIDLCYEGAAFLLQEIVPNMNEENLLSFSIFADFEESKEPVCGQMELEDYCFTQELVALAENPATDKDKLVLYLTALGLLNGGYLSLRATKPTATGEMDEVRAWLLHEKYNVRIAAADLFNSHCHDHDGNLLPPEENTEYLGPEETEKVDL